MEVTINQLALSFAREAAPDKNVACVEEYEVYRDTGNGFMAIAKIHFTDHSTLELEMRLPEKLKLT